MVVSRNKRYQWSDGIMINEFSHHEPDPVFMRAVSEMSEFGFKFASSNKGGVRVDVEFDPKQPSVVMVSDPSVMPSVLPNAIACMYENAPSSSYLFFALDVKSTTKETRQQLAELGGFFCKVSGTDVWYGSVPMKTDSCSYDSYGEGYEKDLMNLMSTLAKLKIKTVPYPCTSEGLTWLPMFADYAFQKMDAKPVVQTLSNYFGNCLGVLGMEDSLRSLVERSVLDATPVNYTNQAPRMMRA